MVGSLILLGGLAVGAAGLYVWMRNSGQGGGKGRDKPPKDVLTYEGEPVTYDGEPVTTERK